MPELISVKQPEGISQERRRSPRFKLALQIQLLPKGANVPMRLETMDVSENGCYVETIFPLDVGGEVEIVLWLGDDKVLAGGKVATRHPHFGNGIEFTDMTDEARRRWKLFLASMLL
jgi:PilZ domain